MVTQPRVITLCGSTRFADTFHQVNRDLTLAGWIVLAPGSYSHSDGHPITTDQKHALDSLHLAKIRMSDAVFVVDPGGYIGESTRREIAYAERIGRPVAYLSRGDQAQRAVSGSTLVVATDHDGRRTGRCDRDG